MVTRRMTRLVAAVPIAAVLVAALLAVAGCAPGSAPPNAAAPPNPTAPPGPPAATGPLLAFSATTLEGASFDGMSLEGKPVVLWFWAPWCPICLQQAPGVREAVSRYGGQVGIVGVAGLDKTEAMPEFVRLAKVEDMIHLADEAGVVWKRFEVTSQSIFVLLDADGRVVFKGRLDADEVPEHVADLLA